MDLKLSLNVNFELRKNLQRKSTNWDHYQTPQATKYLIIKYKQTHNQYTICTYFTYFSTPRNASGSIVTILFSYNVSISRVSKPSNALLWITPILL